MSTEIDPNEIAAKVVLEAFERSAISLGRAADDAYDALSIKLKAGFRRYKKKNADNYGYVRTILHRDKQIPIRDLYVETFFSHDRKTLTDAALIEKIAHPCRILVQGTAGGGKSVFLRLLNTIVSESKSSILPIFLELRSLNSSPGKTIKKLSAEYLSENGLDYSDSAVENLINNGKVLFILDGFDEINHELREDYAQQISDICKNHPNASVVVSSRPDELVASVERLSIYRAKPFNREQAIELLKKLPYNETVRSKFINEITPEFYSRHKDFLSIPLLVTMMLMTYQQFAEIPTKSYLIYENAFTTLFSWHDSSKEVFKRKSYANLPIDEFKRFFAYFCFDSYIDQKFQFPEWDMLERIGRAAVAEDITADKDDLLKDLLISVCLMQKDGLQFNFVHRSFQEYFSAFYITRLDDKNAKIALESSSKRAMSDLVIPMVQAMAPALFERAWALPTVRAINKKIEGSDPKGDPFGLFKIFFHTFAVEPDQMTLTYRDTVWGKRLMALSRSYVDTWEKLPPGSSKEGIEEFYAALRTNDSYRREVEDQTGTALSGDALTADRLPFGTGSSHEALARYLKIREWAQIEVNSLRALEVRLAERVTGRGTSFKTALEKRRRP